MILVPAGLRRTAAVLLLCLPLSIVHVALMRQTHWWRLNSHQYVGATIPALVAVLVVAVFMLRGKRFGALLALSFGAFWVLTSALAAVRLHNSSMGFFSVLLCAGFVFYGIWLEREFGRSFVGPEMKWYEGLPKPLPGVDCRIGSASDKTEFRVNRLDREGAFIYSASSPVQVPQQISRGSCEIFFAYRGKSIRCSGVPVTALLRWGQRSGYGLQFKGMSDDAKKSLGDFIEILKGEGYVS